MMRNDMNNLRQDLKKVQSKYPGINFGSLDDAKRFISIYNILEANFRNIDAAILIDAYLNQDNIELKTANDHYYLVAKSVLKFSKMKKMAYPMGNGVDRADLKVDMDEWIGLVHQIYSAVQKGYMPFHKALDYYADTLEDKNNQRFRFKKWIMYYRDKEHEKYAEEKETMNKKSDYQFGLAGGTYPHDHGFQDESVKQRLDNMEVQRQKDEEFETWKAKVNGAIRRIDKLLRDDQNLTSEDQADLAQLLHAFDLQVRSLRLSSIASDIAFRTANDFKKVGYHPASEILAKVAQELESAPMEVPGPDTEAPEMASEPSANEGAPSEAAGPAQAIGRALETGETDEGSRGDVFDELAGTRGQMDLAFAASKLEDVAARLSDRRTIRQLAEFDILLDKLGLAAMFPELAEAQSKLIDAYSYALVRVTKMLGMLASGRSMVEISDAKKTDISNRAIKDVNKTLTQGEQPVAGKGTEAIQQEFVPEPPATGPVAPPEPIK